MQAPASIFSSVWVDTMPPRVAARQIGVTSCYTLAVASVRSPFVCLSVNSGRFVCSGLFREHSGAGFL